MSTRPDKPSGASAPPSKPPVDLFQKCRGFTRADEMKQAGIYPYFHAIEENEGPVSSSDGKFSFPINPYQVRTFRLK